MKIYIPASALSPIIEPCMYLQLILFPSLLLIVSSADFKWFLKGVINYLLVSNHIKHGAYVLCITIFFFLFPWALQSLVGFGLFNNFTPSLPILGNSPSHLTTTLSSHSLHCSSISSLIFLGLWFLPGPIL